MKAAVISTLAIACLGLGSCGEGPTASRVAKILPDSGVNVWVEIEVSSPAPYHPDVVVEVAKLLDQTRGKLKAGSIKPGAEVQYVSAMVTTIGGDVNRFDFGNLRFPIGAFTASPATLGDPRKLLDTADMAEPGGGPGFQAAHAYCRDDENRKASPQFCGLVDLDEREVS